MPRARTNVRTHKRTLASGRRVTVHRHHRKVTLAHTAMGLLNRPHRSPRSTRKIMSPGRAFWTLRHAARAVRRKKHGRALGLVTLGLGELVGWLTFRTTGLVVATIVAVLSTVAMILLSRTSPDTPRPVAKKTGTPGGRHRAVNKAIK